MILSVVRLLRPHQWSKNLLVFTSLVLAHQYDDVELVVRTLTCFLAFCCVASAGYIANDWLDLEDDRNHPEKCRRPLAAAEVGPGLALCLAAVLIVAGLALAATVNVPVLAATLTYLLATLFYSLWLKRVLLLDVVMLTFLYLLRIVGGVAVMRVEPSFWLLAFAMFVFFSLAGLKRFSELRERESESLEIFSVRAWQPEDATIVAGLGLATGALAVVVLAFYIDSAVVRAAYAFPPALWLLCPLLLYWVGRVWLLANRSLVHGDPVLFAMRDRLSYIVAVVALSIILVAR